MAHPVPSFTNFFASRPSLSTKENGIHLRGKKIKQVSGPASLYYLKPSEETWQHFHEKGTDLPLLLLLGDIHFSERGRCYPCNAEPATSACYALEDKSFLRLFDDLAEETPIDFFTESSEETIRPNKLQRTGVHSRLMEATHRAHQVALRSQPLTPSNQERDLLVPTVRWHYANVRTMSRWVESSLLEPFAIYLQRLSPILSNRALPPIIHPTFQQPPAEIRAATYDLLFLLLEPETDTVEETVEALVTAMLDTLSGPFAEQSGIFKQYRQSAIRHHLPFEAFIPLLVADLLQDTTFRDILSFFMESYDKKIPEFIMLNTLCELHLIDYQSPSPPPPHPNKERFGIYVDYMSQVLTILEHHLMDLYFIFRMLKVPKGSTTATLCVAYMGDAHITSLINHFTNPLFGYTMAYKNPGNTHWPIHSPDDALRCIRIDAPVYLERDVMEHHVKRFGTRPNALQPYHNIIKREKAGRTFSSRSRNRNRNRNRNHNRNRTHRNHINAKNNT